jgi:hypothetical protein
MTEPIFKNIFAEDWDILPPVIKKHYANRPYSSDIVIIKGTLDVMCKGPVKWLSPLLWMMRGIPPHNEQNVPVTVTFRSEPESKAFVFDRDFDFKTRKPYHFKSHMLQVEGNEVVEIMPFGIGWRMNYLWQDNKVILKHKGYVLHLFGHFMPLPLTVLIGKGYAEERAVDDNTFEMSMQIMHPVWGKIYGYKGRFSFRDYSAEDKSKEEKK